MANKSKVQSVEPDIADLVNGWLKSYGLDYKLEQASLNSEIDKALDEYHSKSGGKGGNRPDAKLLLKDKYGTFYPVLIEYIVWTRYCYYILSRKAIFHWR